jgi:thiol-disulfide isomerase/thioredoxin
MVLWYFLVFPAFIQSSQTDWPSLKRINDGANVSLSELAGGKDIVLIFATDNCPYNNRYRSRIQALVELFKGVQFIEVNTTKSGDPLFDINGVLTCIDPGNQMQQKLGARKSPEVFVLKGTSDTFMTFYSGAIDDDPQSSGDVLNPYLEMALEALKSGEYPSTPTTVAPGCVLR